MNDVIWTNRYFIIWSLDFKHVSFVSPKHLVQLCLALLNFAFWMEFLALFGDFKSKSFWICLVVELEVSINNFLSVIFCGPEWLKPLEFRNHYTCFNSKIFDMTRIFKEKKQVSLNSYFEIQVTLWNNSSSTKKKSERFRDFCNSKF